tara:strand:- start:2150 stop:2860 length:711 start_codon:yes stop_codon:yes gene_type:complete
MAFNQQKFDRATYQTRGIFNTYVYETTDSASDVLTAGYFDACRFKGEDGWLGGAVKALTADGFIDLQITSAGLVVIAPVATSSDGYGVYTDSEYTSTPFVITNGNTEDMPNNAASVIEELPPGSAGYYNGSRITPDALADAYMVRLGFEAASSINNGAFNVSIDISAAGDGSVVISGDPQRMVRGSNSFQRYTITLPIYCRETFVANGGLVRLEAIDGTISIRRISFFITKLYSGA